MRINLRKLQKSMVYTLFISQFLFMINLGYIGPLAINIPFLTFVLYYIVSIVGIIHGSIQLNQKCFFIAFGFVLVFIISCFANPYYSNINSLILHAIYFFSFALLDRRHTEEGVCQVIEISIVIIGLCSVYGVYQFLAYNIVPALPFKEIIPENLWVNGYNTLQKFNLFGLTMIKPHSIYSEASNLSKYSAIGLAFMLDERFRNKRWSVFTIANVASLVLSFSGSGIMIIGVVSLYKFFKSKGKEKILFLVLSIVLLFVYLFVSNTEIIGFYLKRIGEFGGNNTSAFYRFVLPFRIGYENMLTKPIGFGLGNDDIAFLAYHAEETAISNGFGKMFVENGVIGLSLLILFFFVIKPKKNKNLYVGIFTVIIVTLNFVGGYMTPVFWADVLLLLLTRNVMVAKE